MATLKNMPEELQQTLADRLQKSLKYAGISHGEMAEYLEVHRNTVGGWCTGKTYMMPALLRLWAEHTKLPASWFRTGEWPEPEPAAPAPLPAAKAVARAAKRVPAKRTGRPKVNLHA